ncbi:hypothetical protein ACFVKB_05075 [Rhodococcus sp. NPDC127530]|uniref:hypothetical protein n=1 Tax=unclassified Rhodococcus (in: high G+C Gram-positive bacteria) TaxID=192944 RepID=UPI00364505D2
MTPVPRGGWRMWSLNEDGYLTSKWGACDSYQSPIITAECATYGCTDVPGPNCRCGIYFVEDASAMIRETYRHTVFERGYSSDFPMPVLTLVEPMGRIVDAPIEPKFGGAKVWRAASVRIAAIVIDSEIRKRGGQLSDTYGVPIHVGLLEPVLRAVERAHRTSTAGGAPSITNPLTHSGVVGIGALAAEGVRR